MSSYKDTFEANTFEAGTFACGTWRGAGAIVVAPDPATGFASTYRGESWAAQSRGGSWVLGDRHEAWGGDSRGGSWTDERRQSWASENR